MSFMFDGIKFSLFYLLILGGIQYAKSSVQTQTGGVERVGMYMSEWCKVIELSFPGEELHGGFYLEHEWSSSCDV